MSDNLSALESALKQLKEAGQAAGIDDDVLTMLQEPQRVFITTFPVRMDNGKVRFFKGFRVQHSHALGQTGGGTRFHPQETLDDVKALALWMSVKNALNGIPAGGGKGGVICDPSELSCTEKERVCRAYVRAVAPMLGTRTDYPGADVGTDSEMMSWMLDEWEQIHGLNHEPTAISGKTVVLGGSQGRPQATGLGVCLSVREALRLQDRSLEGVKVAVQGYGKVGSWAARLLQDEGAVLVAAGDFYGSIYNPQGIDAYKLDEFVQSTGSVLSYPQTQKLDSSTDVLFVECDVLIPAAIQSTITADNHHKIQAKLIVEGANGPVTPAAETELLKQGVIIIPDILANGGGTSIAYLERVQGVQNYYWTEDEVVARYEQLFVRKFKEVYETAQQEGLSLRMAAWAKALRTLAEAIKARGWV
ncbi:NAD-specific glutamate dehydrogenase [Paradesulfitobacterium aromaticivorans]